MENRIRIIHADDQRFTRQSTTGMLREEGIDVVGEASNGIELLRILNDITPDLILLDLEMPRMDGNQVLRVLKTKYPSLKIVVFTSFSEECLIEDFKEKGVNAFLTKDTDVSIIANTIKKVHYSNGYDNFPHRFNSKFTPREIKIIPYLLAGKTSKDIAGILEISSRTVESVRARVYGKTKCKNASEFAVFCAKQGLEFLGYTEDLKGKKHDYKKK